MPRIRAVVSVIGRDQKGVVAQFATHLADQGVNIEDIAQRVVRGQFIMDMLVDLTDMSISLDELITDLLKLGQSIEMEVRVTLHDRGKPKRVAVLCSKEPHCLAQLIKQARTGQLRGEIVQVLANHDVLRADAEAVDLPFASLPATDKAAHFKWVHEQLDAVQPDLIVLARYMQILPPEIVADYRHKIINIHPSLLPHFPGARPYHQAWESGVRVTGCTAHFVTEDLDEGPVILQDVFHIDVGHDTAEDVKDKGKALEARVLSDACQMFLDEKLAVVDNKVVFRPGISTLLDHAE